MNLQTYEQDGVTYARVDCEKLACLFDIRPLSEATEEWAGYIRRHENHKDHEKLAMTHGVHQD